jgi:hypothetical protein
MQKRQEHPDDRDSEREELDLDPDADPERLLGTPPPGTQPGGQGAGRVTGAEPAEPGEGDEAG